MGTCCSTNTPSAAAVVDPARLQQQQQQQAATVLAPAAVTVAEGKQSDFTEFQGRGLAGEAAEIINATDLDVVKKICLEKGYSGFTIRDGMAHFHNESVRECLQILSSEADSTFYASAAGRSANEVCAMTYNLYWWNLYGRRNGNNASASHLIAGAMPDLIGFQECDDVSRVFFDIGLQNDYAWIQGPGAVAIAYKHHWSLLSEHSVDVAVDEPEQFYGNRYMLHARLRNTITGHTILFASHHGPLRVNSGGRNGGVSTANNIMNEINRCIQPRDSVILVGDFNACPGTPTITNIEAHLPRAFTGLSFGGVDHIFSRLPKISQRNLGNGGSDHDSLIATFIM